MLILTIQIVGIENLDSEVKDRSEAVEKMQVRVEVLVLAEKRLFNRNPFGAACVEEDGDESSDEDVK